MWLLVFFLTPIVEMYLLIQVGGHIGAWPTIALVMLTAVIGVSILRVQGLKTLTRGVQRLDSGELPAQEVVEGLLLAFAGALLLTPGFVTDTVGFLLLMPRARQRLAVLLLERFSVRTRGGTGSPHRPGQILEGDYQRLDDDEKGTSGP